MRLQAASFPVTTYVEVNPGSMMILVLQKVPF